MDILEVIALLSLCIASIKLGMEINKNAKNNRPVLRKLTVIFITYLLRATVYRQHYFYI